MNAQHSHNKRPEILAPAGDWDCVRAAVENGADAIYFGLERFNARMRAKNFTQADLPALMEFLHKRGVRGYVTFNTLVFANELDDARDYARSIIAAGADAAIVQDVGVCRLIREISPDFPIHASTQMTVTNPAGVEFARELGAELVVLARENTIADIETIQAAQRALVAEGKIPAPIPLEVFVHGALCVAYSGQCLTSEALGGRSANRGECAQACRLPYELVSDGKKVELGDRRYLLSPRDLAGLDVLPQLVRSGVASLKIEGRLKSPEYVASITRVYRAALDQALASAEIAKAKYELEMTFSRGLSTGWFGGIDNQQLVHARFGTKRGVLLGEISRVQNESVTLRLAAALKPGDGVVFDAGTPEIREEGGRVYQVEMRKGAAGGAGDEATLRFGHGDINFNRVRAGQLLWKTNDPALDRELRATFEGEKIRHTREVDIEAHGHAGAPLTVILNDRDGHVVKLESAVLLAGAQTQPLTNERLRDQLGRLGGTPFKLGEMKSRIEGDVMLPMSELNRLRRDAVEQLTALRAAPKRWVILESNGGRASSPSAAWKGRSPVNEPSDVAEIIPVVRNLAQLDAALTLPKLSTFYCEFENPKHYRDAVTRFRERRSDGSTIWVLPPRITKPGEEWILNQVRSCNADGYLVRNAEHLRYFANERKRGDFSLNVANQLSAEYFLAHYGLERVTASYDLNIAQLDALLNASAALPHGAASYDITIHQHMPMFHMEHCVFCAFLSTGKDYHDCGRPCEKHEVRLRDRTGAEFPLKADAGCRNTVFNNRAQTGAEYAARLVALGARHFRVEFVNESADEVVRTLTRYQQLLRGEIDGAALWRELKLLNQIGVTRGQMEAAPQVIQRKN